MALDETFLGRRGGRARITIERGPVAAFAKAVKSANPIHSDARAAAAAGFDAVPTPPTFLIAAGVWGKLAEDQPADAGVDPTREVIAEYARQGGLMLHAEQTYTFVRPVVVGDVLDMETTCVDTYTKGRLTFAKLETRYTDSTTDELVATALNNLANRQ